MRTSYVSLFLVMAFFVSSIGAKDCAFNRPSPTPPPSDPASDKPFCPTDPPFGCAALCVNVDEVAFSDECAELSAGPMTAQFKENVFEYVQLVHSEGMLICNEPDSLGAFVTPCDLGYVPSIGTESLDACMLRPQACP